MSMGFVDTIMAGRYKTADLAAVALGTSIWIPVFLFVQGVIMATTPLVAHLAGAEKQAQTRNILYQGAIISLGLCFVAILFLNNCQFALELMDTPAELTKLTTSYLSAISFGFPALLGYQLVRSYVEGLGKTSPFMLFSIIGLLCNIPLNYILIYGKLGLPALGGVGCGWATSIVMWVMLLIAIFYIAYDTELKKLNIFAIWAAPKLIELKQFILLGLPIGVALLIESSMFSIIALLLADAGAVKIASHQITLNFTAMAFMLPLSISMALTIRVGHYLGSKQADSAKFCATTGLMINFCIAVFTSILIVTCSKQIAKIYTSDLAIIALVSELLLIAALYQFPDALQIACSGILRGYKDTSIPLLLVFIAYWIIGLPSGYLLGKTNLMAIAMGPKGFWIGLCLGLTTGAILLLRRVYYISNQQFPTYTL